MMASRLPLTLRQLLGSLYLIGMIALTSIVIVFLQERLSAYFYENLLENGRVIVERLAEESRLSIIQGIDEPIRPHLEAVAAYPNVTEVVLATAQGKTVSALGSHATDPRSAGWADGPTETTRHFERPDSITIVAPVFERNIISPDFNPFSDPLSIRRSGTPPSPSQSTLEVGATSAPIIIGFVSLTLSKIKLQNDIRNIQKHIVTVMWIAIMSITIAMLILLNWITRPVRRLAQVMSDPKTVEQFRQVKVRGVRETQLIATAFNALIAQVEKTNRELMDSNVALTASQANLAQQVEDATKELKQQNRELNSAREQALAANRVKSMFMANMSHEIRTPLHGVIASADLLLKTRLPNKQQRNCIKTISHSAYMLLNLVNNVLDLSKLEATGKVVITTVAFDLLALIGKTVSIISPEARDKKLKVVEQMDPATPCWVYGDPTRLGQIFLNLLNNAVKFTESGSVTLLTRILPTSPMSDDDDRVRVQFSVIDTGIGIAEEEQKRIFDIFIQAHPDIARDYGGTGLGLNITKRLVYQLGGEIGVRSAPGKGSCFWFELLLQRTVNPRCQTKPSVRSAGSQGHATAGGASRSLRILVAEDNRSARFIILSILRNAGHQVQVVTDGQAALEALQSPTRFDLAILDLQMPKLYGTEVIARYRQNEESRPTPFILLTADVTPEAESKARIVGIDRFLTKPITANGLLDAVETVVGRKRLGQTGNTEPTSESVARVRSLLRPDMLARISQISSTTVPRVIHTFIRDVDSGIDHIRKTIASEDWEGIKEAVHRLKGATTIIGADQLTGLCETMRYSADRRDRMALKTGLENLQAAQTEVIKSLKEHLSRRQN